MPYSTGASLDFQLNLFSELNEVDLIEVESDEAATANSLKVCSQPLTSLQNYKDSNDTTVDSLEVCSQYLASLQNYKDSNDTKNALIRYFIPSVDGPKPSARKHRSTSPEETQAAFEFLKTVPLNVLANSPDLATKILHELDISPTHQGRARSHLRSLVDWAQGRGYLSPPENPIPEGICAHIKVGLFEGLNLRPANAREILEKYLEQVDNRETELDTINAVVRFFVPGCGGPIIYHKPALDYEMEAGLKYLETIPLEYLNEARTIATVALKALDNSIRHGTRIRNALRYLIKWARAEQYLPRPNSVAPWGGECLPQAVLSVKIATEIVEQKTLFEAYHEYRQYLEQNGRAAEINPFQTAVVRYFVPSCGGVAPTHAKATAKDTQSALDYLKTIPLDHLSNGINSIEVEFDRLDIPVLKRRPIRSRLRGWLKWFMEQNSKFKIDEVQEPQPVFNTFYTNGVKREHKKPGMALHQNRAPVHVLCAKRFPDDYINDYLQKQLDDYIKWRHKNKVNSGGTKTEKEQILQLLGWLHRYEGVPLSALSFEKMITRSKLLFFASDYENYQEYLMQKDVGIQDARKQADKDIERVERYLEFAAKTAGSELRRLSIVLSLAKFLYKDLYKSDDFPEYRDIPILRRLLDIHSDQTRWGETTRQSVSYGETSTSWEQAVMVMKQARYRAELTAINVRNHTHKGYATQQRPDTALAKDLQSFLSIAFCILIPSRSRTFYDLRIGETFKEGILTSRGLLSIQDLKKQGCWEEHKDSVRFYIHHGAEDFKSGKSMTRAMLESEGWWAEIPNISFDNTRLYDYIRRWLEWGREARGPVNHHFFFQSPASSKPMNAGNWSKQIKIPFSRWTGVPVTPNSIRKMFASHFPEHKEGAALLLQHSETMHTTHYDMRQTVIKMQPVMEANEQFINGVLSNKEE